MSEMIERVAFALEKLQMDAGDYAGLSYVDLAKAAIGAMKGPTDAMMAAGRPIDIRALRGVDSIYNAMIEEALK